MTTVLTIHARGHVDETRAVLTRLRQALNPAAAQGGYARYFVYAYDGWDDGLIEADAAFKVVTDDQFINAVGQLNGAVNAVDPDGMTIYGGDHRLSQLPL